MGKQMTTQKISKWGEVSERTENSCIDGFESSRVDYFDSVLLSALVLVSLPLLLFVDRMLFVL